MPKIRIVMESIIHGIHTKKMTIGMVMKCKLFIKHANDINKIKSSSNGEPTKEFLNLLILEVFLFIQRIRYLPTYVRSICYVRHLFVFSVLCTYRNTHTHIYIYRKRRHRVMYVQRESVCACVWPYDRTRGNPIVKEEKSSGNSLKRSLISNSLKKLNHITLKIVFITLNGISQQWCCFVRVFPLFDNKNAKSGWAKKWKRMNTHINVHP